MSTHTPTMGETIAIKYVAHQITIAKFAAEIDAAIAAVRKPKLANLSYGKCLELVTRWYNEGTSGKFQPEDRLKNVAHCLNEYLHKAVLTTPSQQDYIMMVERVARAIAPVRNRFYRGSKGDDKNYADMEIAKAAIAALTTPNQQPKGE